MNLLILVLYVIAGIMIPYLSLHLWMRDGKGKHSKKTAVFLYPWATLVRGLWSTQTNHLYRHGRSSMRSKGMDFIITENTRFQIYNYYALHIFFWPIRIAFNLTTLAAIFLVDCFGKVVETTAHIKTH